MLMGGTCLTLKLPSVFFKPARNPILEFTDAETALDRAATVLRLLYLRDLRTLQTQIDEALVRVQASASLFAPPLLTASTASHATQAVCTKCFKIRIAGFPNGACPKYVKPKYIEQDACSCNQTSTHGVLLNTK